MMLNIRTFTCNPFAENAMILTLGKGPEAIIVDPGNLPGREQDEMFGYIEEKGLKPLAVILTHAHLDHCFGATATQLRYGIPVYMNPDEEMIVEVNRKNKKALPMIDTDWQRTSVCDGQVLEIGPFRFEVIATPGHTPGSVCYLDREHRALFTGDTLFAGTIGRTDLEGGDYDKLIVSIMDKLMGLDGDISIYPGHGPASSISDERTKNPFLEPFNEPGEETSFAADAVDD